jgi:hypothetical protein
VEVDSVAILVEMTLAVVVAEVMTLVVVMKLVVTLVVVMNLVVMKPVVAILVNLNGINKPPDSYKHLKVVYDNKDILKSSYINYIFFARKYRVVDIPRNSIVKKIGKHSFVEHYNNPKGFSSFIDKFRGDNRSGFCYMCGALSAGTLDHLLPKDEYPEFSFFSKNLIPSCDCNQKKKENISSGLNPHFYEECDEELYYLDISLNGVINNQISYDFEIKVKKIFSNNFNELIEYHLNNHILKFSDIENYMKNHYG